LISLALSTTPTPAGRMPQATLLNSVPYVKIHA
jgi:hypothetical protein